MAHRVQVSVWRRKVERAMSDPEAGNFRIVRLPLEWRAGDDTDDAELIDDLSAIESSQGVYLLQETDEDGDPVRTITECRVGRRGERLGNSPDPIIAASRTMNMQAESWQNLVNSHERMVKQANERAEKLEKERDTWRDKCHELMMAANEEPESENKLYEILQTAFAAYLVHDKKTNAKDFVEKELLPRLKPEQRKEISLLAQEALRDNTELALALAAHKTEDEPS